MAAGNRANPNGATWVVYTGLAWGPLMSELDPAYPPGFLTTGPECTNPTFCVITANQDDFAPGSAVVNGEGSTWLLDNPDTMRLDDKAIDCWSPYQCLVVGRIGTWRTTRG